MSREPVPLAAPDPVPSVERVVWRGLSRGPLQPWSVVQQWLTVWRRPLMGLAGFALVLHLVVRLSPVLGGPIAYDQALPLALALQLLLAAILWPALAGPAGIERLRSLGGVPVPLLPSVPLYLLQLQAQGQLILLIVAWAVWNIGGDLLLGIPLLQGFAVLALAGMVYGGVWQIGRHYWGAESLRPGTFLLLLNLLGLTAVLYGGALPEQWTTVQQACCSLCLPWLVWEIYRDWNAVLTSIGLNPLDTGIWWYLVALAGTAWWVLCLPVGGADAAQE